MWPEGAEREGNMKRCFEVWGPEGKASEEVGIGEEMTKEKWEALREGLMKAEWLAGLSIEELEEILKQLIKQQEEEGE